MGGLTIHWSDYYGNDSCYLYRLATLALFNVVGYGKWKFPTYLSCLWLGDVLQLIDGFVIVIFFFVFVVNTIGVQNWLPLICHQTLLDHSAGIQSWGFML